MQNAMFEPYHAVTPFGQRQVVRRDQRRQAMRAVQPLQQPKHSPGILLVQISGRFIGEQHSRPCNQRPSNRHTLLFSARKLSCTVIGSILEPYLRQPLARLRKRFRLWLTAHEQRHRYIFCCREIRLLLHALGPTC